VARRNFSSGYSLWPVCGRPVGRGGDAKTKGDGRAIGNNCPVCPALCSALNFLNSSLQRGQAPQRHSNAEEGMLHPTATRALEPRARRCAPGNERAWPNGPMMKGVFRVFSPGGSQSQMGARWQNSFQGGANKTIVFTGKAWVGALAKKNPVPRLQFYYFGLKTKTISRNTNVVVARLCWPMRCVDVPRTITTTGPKCRGGSRALKVKKGRLGRTPRSRT
jgi:hypothetical protein